MVANAKYPFSKNGARFQLRYTHDAATSLPISSDPAIIATDNADAENIAIKPAMENHAAIIAIVSATKNVISGNAMF